MHLVQKCIFATRAFCRTKCLPPNLFLHQMHFCTSNKQKPKQTPIKTNRCTFSSLERAQEQGFSLSSKERKSKGFLFPRSFFMCKKLEKPCSFLERAEEQGFLFPRKSGRANLCTKERKSKGFLFPRSFLMCKAKRKPYVFHVCKTKRKASRAKQREKQALFSCEKREPCKKREKRKEKREKQPLFSCEKREPCKKREKPALFSCEKREPCKKEAMPFFI